MDITEIVQKKLGQELQCKQVFTFYFVVYAIVFFIHSETRAICRMSLREQNVLCCVYINLLFCVFWSNTSEFSK